VDEDGESQVNLLTFMPEIDENTAQTTWLHEETVTFPYEESAQRFIKDLSNEAVAEFLKRFSY